MRRRYLTWNSLKSYFITAIVSFSLLSCGSNPGRKRDAQGKSDSILNQTNAKSKIAIYQLVVRLFGNKVQGRNLENGSIEENGCGRFNDITDRALDELKKTGITHVWYTGIIEHATMTDYSRYGIKKDDPDVVKGRAGSPYAIKDYYDVDPDLSEDPQKRMAEFELLVKRTHEAGLKVIIDFVPNHVARSYYSDKHPDGVRSFGLDDDIKKAFSEKNDFYYILDKPLVVPKRKESVSLQRKLGMDGLIAENPAKATGNNVFSNTPSVDDWFETVKLNYGVDYQNKSSYHFVPVPPVWNKMFDILSYWASKGIDGFRCDVAEMVPVEFWNWVLPKLKEKHPGVFFIAEAYDPAKYEEYLTKGHFDYLYDKVGLYDCLKSLIKEEKSASTASLTKLNERYATYSDKMLRFLENHDEERIASDAFAGNPWKAVPAMVASATLSGGPVMIYFGQEVGEPAYGIEGFSGNDGRTTIFDYWAVPEHQKWMNGGKFDGGQLTDNQKKLRAFYATLTYFSTHANAIKSGKLLEIPVAQNPKGYAYWRYTEDEVILVVLNFDYHKSFQLPIAIADALPAFMKNPDRKRKVVLGKQGMQLNNGSLTVTIPEGEAIIYQFTK